MNAIDYADFRQMKSFRLRFPLSRSRIRASEENFGRIADGGICVLPLYFIGELDRFMS